MSFRVWLVLACVAALPCCRRGAERCGRSEPLVMQRAAMVPRDGWLPVAHRDAWWYLEPTPSVCVRHFRQVTIEKDRSGGYVGTLAVTPEGRRAVADLTRVPGEYLAISVFGKVHSIPVIKTPIDSESATITFSDAELPAWQKVAAAVNAR